MVQNLEIELYLKNKHFKKKNKSKIKNIKGKK